VIDDLFREALESQEKDNTPLFRFVHSDDVKYAEILAVFSTFSFKDLFFEFLSWTVKDLVLGQYLMLQSQKLADDSPVRCA
jgi:hypothetical protein